ncbi:MAG: GlsB/YeaQ/YmgE family stress response membrane protein [Acidimicrobiia bacterium]|nr:GlsB/YeaQ/YmgE family stress response membrane protein [Acidimicrobiia bacterium]
MSWLSWVVVGLVAGVVARAVTGVRGAGCLGTIVIGILGGLLGGIFFKAAGGEGINEFSLYSVLVAVVGASVLLFVYGAVAGRGRGDRPPP